MLVALAAKNAILIFEFAVLNRAGGASFYDAAVTAARERLRPIVMTSVAFILGCVPLAIATGASANSRISIGTGVIGGMLAATMLAVFWIPMFYYVIETLAERFARRGKAKAAPPEVAGPQPPAAGASAGHVPRARPPGE
jgi:multidrug efflux pump